MFFNNLFYFLKGYVIIEVEGLFIERFINICVHRGIKLKRIVKTKGTILYLSFDDFKKLRPVVRKTKSKIRILKKCGLPIIYKKYKKRYAFFIGAFLFSIFLLITSSLILSIEINGANHIPHSEILEVLKQEGVEIGAPRFLMSTAGDIKNSLLYHFDSISWAWIYKEGTKIRVEIKEGILPPEVVDKSNPCDIIAMRDGLICEATVKEGRLLTPIGNAVMAGDVLIAGTIEPENAPMYTVHAIGDVYAVTWHEKTGIYNLFKEHRLPTGKKKTSVTFNLFSKSFTIGNHDFAEYDITQSVYEAHVGKYYLGFGFTITNYIEVSPYTEPIPAEAALSIAQNELEQQIAADLLPHSKLRKRELEYTNIDDSTIKVTLTMEFLENIGTEKQIYTNGDL